MERFLKKHVFHEFEAGGTAFRATLYFGSLHLHAEAPDGREADVDLAGMAACLCYREAWKDFNRREHGPGWALCKYGPNELVMHLGELSDGEAEAVAHEFGLNIGISDYSLVSSPAAFSLKHIVADDPKRASLFRKNAKWLDAWLEKVSSEAAEPPAPGM